MIAAFFIRPLAAAGARVLGPSVRSEVRAWTPAGTLSHRMSERPGYPGENPAHQMSKLERSNPKVVCGSCRQFDGGTWCRRWNYQTAPDAPICAFYRPALKPPPRASG